MARTTAEHVVFEVIDLPEIEIETPETETPETETPETDKPETDKPETPCECGPDCRKAYRPVMGVDGKGAGLAWITQKGVKGTYYRVGSFSTEEFTPGATEKIVVTRGLIARA